MKVLEGLEELKYMALLASYNYDVTGNKIFIFALKCIIDETFHLYGGKGVNEVVDFIKDERL